MAPQSNDKHENGTSMPNGSNREHATDGVKAGRHPRWTREETVILIQGKMVVEDRIHESHSPASGFGSEQSEPKWDLVASYCQQRGVNRRPVQCQKRWGNLLVDFKKIKRWESRTKQDRESFWVMRNDLRKEMKLPGYFDREVYDVLEGAFAVPAVPLTQVTASTDAKGSKVYEIMTVKEEEKDDEELQAEVVFDSNQNAAAEDGLFSDSELSQCQEQSCSTWKKVTASDSPGNDSEPSQGHELGCSPEKKATASKSPGKKGATGLHISDTVKEKHSGASTCIGFTSQERRKRTKLSSQDREDTTMGDQLIKVLERNSSILNAQLDAQNLNCQLEREQKKGQSDNLIAAMNKLTDALSRIADKL